VPTASPDPPFEYRLGLSLAATVPAWADEPARGYAVVISEATRSDPAWAAVAVVLAEKHRARVLVYDKEFDGVADRLKALYSRFSCFVAKPEEDGKQFVACIHRMTRQLDEDPYTDTSWGILIGYTPEAALKIARFREPLTVRDVAAGTEIALDMCEQGRWYSELESAIASRSSDAIGRTPETKMGWPRPSHLIAT
jgi:hypothetical protein